ncbi:MAG: serine/threonine-protein kinase [Thermoanaerobaculia bacterium]
MTSEAPSESSARFANYDIIGTIGRGAMGVVYLAKDRRIGRCVALKAVHYEQAAFEESRDAREFFDRLRREAELSGMLQHPNIVTLYEAGIEGTDVNFLAFEYVEGQSLRQIIRDGALPVAEALAYAEGILKGLAYAHSRGVIHRDIKPGNILVNAEGEAKLADFGIARPIESTLTIAGTLVGTPSYMSPEQISGDPVSPAADLFSFGAVLYEMLLGTKPFAATDVNAILYNIVHREFIRPSALRPDLERFDAYLEKLLAKRPADRFASAQAALDELRAIRGADAGKAAPSRVAGSGLLRADVRPWHVAVVVAALLLPLLVWSSGAIREAAQVGNADETAARLQALSVKKNELARVEALVGAGKLDEAVIAFEQYLRAYPESLVAREGLADVRRRLEERRLAEVQRLAESDAPVQATPAAVTQQQKSEQTKQQPNVARRSWDQLRKKVKKIF